MDETGLFFRDSGNHSFFVKGQDCHGGKRSKDRITVSCCANMIGEKEPLVVIPYYKYLLDDNPLSDLVILISTQIQL
jgi:hypothetical protein